MRHSILLRRSKGAECVVYVLLCAKLPSIVLLKFTGPKDHSQSSPAALNCLTGLCQGVLRIHHAKPQIGGRRRKSELITLFAGDIFVFPYMIPNIIISQQWIPTHGTANCCKRSFRPAGKIDGHNPAPTRSIDVALASTLGVLLTSQPFTSFIISFSRSNAALSRRYVSRSPSASSSGTRWMRDQAFSRCNSLGGRNGNQQSAREARIRHSANSDRTIRAAAGSRFAHDIHVPRRGRLSLCHVPRRPLTGQRTARVPQQSGK